MHKVFDPKLFRCDFPFEMIMSVVTTSDGMSIEGHFRNQGDYGALIWDSVDKWSHTSQKYNTNYDYSGIKLSYDFEYSGYVPGLGDEQRGPVITVTMLDGTMLHVRLWNYIVNRPLDDWEKASIYREGPIFNENPPPRLTFPRNRVPGNSNGFTGRIEIDFDNLYAGWSEWVWVGPYYNWQWAKSGTDITKDDHWVKVDPTQIKEIMWGFVPATYVDKSTTPLDGSQYFKAVFSNWTVSGAKSLGNPLVVEAHKVRLCDGYDDSYDVTPERLVDHFYNLGYREIINLYVGASHYYDKKAKKDANGKFVKNNKGQYIYELIQDHALNKAAAAWHLKLFQYAKARGFKEVIASIAFESVDLPDSWKQIAHDGEVGFTMWEPPTYFVSFTNSEAKEYYKKYVKEIVDLQAQAGLVPNIQVGEPWWWIVETKDKPCFYDAATVALYKAETGRDAPIITKTHASNYDNRFTKWLGDQNGKFTWMIRDTIKAHNPAAKCGVLFFPPAVLDTSRMGPMVAEVSFPVNYWKYPQLDYFQVEDYDYLIFDQKDHFGIYDVAADLLNYPISLTHYFSGFVLNHENPTSPLWQRITQAVIDGLERGFETFIWAGPEIRRDNWFAPKAASSDFFKPWLSSEVTTLAWCCRLELLDGTRIGFTSLDTDIILSDSVLGVGSQDLTYEAATGFTPTAIESSRDLAVDNLDIEGIIDSDKIKRNDLLTGRYDGAKLIIFICDWTNPRNKFHILRKGTLGKITIQKKDFQTEIRGLMQSYQQEMGISCQKTCRAVLGDSQCKVNLASYTASGTITSTANGVITTNLTQADGYFDYGVLVFTGGANKNTQVEVKEYKSKTVTFFIPPIHSVQVGDTFIISAGCDNNFSTCRNKFGNVTNFRGEPHVPGSDYLTGYATQGGANVSTTSRTWNR